MKQLIIILIAIFLSGTAIAQKTAVQSGSNYFKYGQLDKAKESLDAAVMHPKTLQNPKAWKKRGDTYLYLYFANIKHEKFADIHKHAGLAEDPLTVTIECYNNTIEFGEGTDYSDDAKSELGKITGILFNLAADNLNNKNYAKSLELFEQVIAMDKVDVSIKPEEKIKLINDAYKFGSSAANASGDTQKSIDFLNQLIARDATKASVYKDLAKRYKKLEQNEKAAEAIKMGREKYPADQSLLLEEINLKLAEGNKEAAIELLTVAINNDPDNAQLMFVKGNMYQQLDDLEKAAAGYNDALTIEPTHFDAIFHLGALYFNKGADISQKAKDLPMGKAYDAAKIEMDGYFAKSQPYLEQALELDPTHYDTLFSLKQLYAHTSNTKKWEEVSAKLKALQ